LVFGDRGGTTKELLDSTCNKAISLSPNVVILCYGMQDGNFQKSNPQTLESYRKKLSQAVQRLKSGGVRLVIITTPTALDPDVFKLKKLPITPEDYSSTLSDLGKVAQDVAKQENAGFIDIYTPMAELIKKAKEKFGPTYLMTAADYVYPDKGSHFILAYTFLKAFGMDGDIGAITLDMASGTATSTAGHKVISSDKGKVELESTRYPFCSSGKSLNPQDPLDPRSILAFFPFNQELNRYLLIVKNASAGNLEVTWGQQSKEFSSDALEKGVNLANEFPDGPFCAPFEAITKEMSRAKSFYNGTANRLLATADETEATIPDSHEVCEKLRKVVQRQSELLKNSGTATPSPVRHVITIAPVAGSSK